MEKVAINSGYYSNDKLIEKAVRQNGSQSILGVIEYKKTIWGKTICTVYCGTRPIKKSPVTLAKELESRGIGELMLNCIDRDGEKRICLDLLKTISSSVGIPAIASCGSHNLDDFIKAKSRCFGCFR